MAFNPKIAANQNINPTLNTHRANGVETSENNLNPTTSSTNGLAQASTNIFIKSNGAIVGMVQSFRVSENRTINKLQAIGIEGVVQAVPSNTNGGTLEVQRIALYGSALGQSLGLHDHAGGVFKTLKDQRVPLEIEVITPMNGADINKQYVETYVDCWLQSYSKSYSVGTITVAENATVSYADVY